MKWILRILIALSAVVALAAIGAVLWLRSSLPPASEERAVRGLHAELTIEYDDLGVPTMRASSEADLAFAQGWSHARDRRFQMELFRRNASGRLSEAVGRAALPSDRWARTLGYAHVADSGFAMLGERRRGLLESYAAGVNAWDAAHAAPPEFAVLGLPREAWRPADGLLVVLAMFGDLQDAGDTESDVDVLDATLPGALVEFLMPSTTPHDVVLAPGPMRAPAPIPGADVVDLRAPGGARFASPATRVIARSTSHSTSHSTSRSTSHSTSRSTSLAANGPLGRLRPARSEERGEERALGSNNWVVGPSRTATGAPIVANDPHLNLRVPNIWHRQRLIGDGLDVTGATLPGYFGVVIGSNGRVAWGLTNAECDASDLVRIEVADADTTSYAGPEGAERFEVREEVIRVKGAAAETLGVRVTRFGPVIGRSARGGLLALQWVALDPSFCESDLFGVNRAGSVAELFSRLREFRGPNQNFAAADRDGHIGWRPSGWVPRRTGFDPRRPREGRDASARWVGIVDADSMPFVMDPPGGFLTTANQRTVGGEGYTLLGDGQAMPWRARRIAQALAGRDDWDAAAIAELQNDVVDSVLLGPTARALDRALTPQACAGDSLLSRIRVVLDRWEHRADTTSVAHAYLRYARIALNDFAIDSLLAPCRARDSSFTFDWALEDEVTRRLLEARPMNLLPASFAEWDDLVRAAAKAATVRIETRAGGEPFDRVTWGRINRSRINHPLGDAVPTLDRWLDMPHAALRGGSGLIRVANARSGASLRMVVDLADSSRSLFSMPGGQSGHFLSPHFADHFAGWVEGRAGAFLPGPPRRTVRLHPAPSR